LALISDSLSIWDIGFRWTGLDPDRFYFRLPLLVKDNFRILMQAILEGEILCETLTLAKRPSDSNADPDYYIRSHIDDVYDCIWGKKYNRKLLKWAVIDRNSFRFWCEIRAIPLPEFWFPTGWKYDFEMPEGGTQALRARHQEPSEGGLFSLRFEPAYIDIEDNSSSILDETFPDNLRASKIVSLCCQKIASTIWKDQPDRTIASMVKDELIQKYGGGDHYAEETVRGWIKVVAPLHVKNKRGRPPKNRDKVE
jgi:hypothetical protein